MSDPILPDYFTEKTVPYQGNGWYWKPLSRYEGTGPWHPKEPRFNFNAVTESYSMEYEFDANQYVRELARKMREMEDDVAEPLIVDWLRSRGWTVEKED